MNAQQQTPRRRFAGFDKLVALFALLVALFTSPIASAANYTDIWWNSAESGWGVTLTHHNDKLFGVWYIYDAAGKPYWVVMSDGVFSADGRTFTGEIHTTKGPSFREPTFRTQNVTIRKVGTARIDFDADEETATATYTIDGMTSTKRITRQNYGIAPANFGKDHSDMWWDDKESGWGLSVSHHGDNIFAVWYTYGDDGKPLWVVMPGGELKGNTFTGNAFTTTGSPYMAGFDTSKTKVTQVGTVTIDFAQGTFRSEVLGVVQSKRIKRQVFGKANTNKNPTIQLAATPGASPLVAPATVTLKATAADADGTVSKVSFFQGCTMIGSDAAAPYEFTVSNLPAGRYYFSARVSDSKGGTALASTQMIEVKAGSGTPPPPPPPPPVTNKAPTVAISAPGANATFVQGANIDIVATAADADGSVARVEFFAGTAKVGEALASPWQATWTNVPLGSHVLAAVATDDMGAAKTSTTIGITVIPPALVVDASTKDAARFLTQATFGIRSVAQIDALKAQGYEAWLNQQFAATWSGHITYVQARLAAGEKADEERAYEAIWQQWLLDNNSQLRARMAFALSEIFVISNIAPDLNTYAMASYMDMLNKNAFGNYRQLLEDVTLHPAMGYYLNMIGSKKADPAKGTHPNENFAREVMQLFSIGLYKLNSDGTREIVGGLPVNTYDQAVIGGMAAAFTGWNFAGNDTNNAAIFNPAKENWRDPMVAWEMWHDTNAKTIFNGITIPAGGNARSDMKAVLDALASHPNVGPFIGRQLIQRFVTSNPSPAYIGRVAAAFNNTSGVRGDLRATLRAVLMDPEARDVTKAATDPTFGKQREPVIRFANFLRALNATSTSGRNKIWYLDSADEGLNQSPLLSPSVFNFFSPNYRQPGPLAAANLVAPEFQITTETSMVGGLNFFSKLIKNGSYGSGDTKLTMNLAELNAMANTPGVLADRLNLLFMNGMMSDGLRSTIVNTLGAMPAMKTNDTTVTDRVRAALILVSISPDFVIQK